MKFFIQIILTGLIFALINSCECVGGHICTDNFYFKIVNKVSGENMVFGYNPVYNPDSVFLFTTQGIRSSIDSPRFRTTLAEPIDTCYLHLNSIDVDTLLISYHIKKTYCCRIAGVFGKIYAIKFNGIPAKKKKETYIFKK